MAKKKEKDKKKGPDLFTFLTQIQTKRRKYPYDKKLAPAYMLTMWLSHDKDLINIINKMNRHQFILPDEVIYEYYMATLPSGKRYIPWTKKRKEEGSFKKAVDILQEKNPRLSVRECKMIYTFLKNRKNK